MTTIKVNNIKIGFEEESLRFTLYKEDTVWEWSEYYKPQFEYEGGSLEFKDAVSVSHEQVENED